MRFLNAVFLTIVISPAFVRGFTLLSQTGAVAQEYASRLTNFVLAHYLNDRVTIQPSKFEHLLGLRSALVEAFLDFETSGAVFMATIASGGFLLVLVRFCAVSTGLTALSWTVFMVPIWEFATAFVGHDAWAILNVQPAVALYHAVLCDAGPWWI